MSVDIQAGFLTVEMQDDYYSSGAAVGPGFGLSVVVTATYETKHLRGQRWAIGGTAGSGIVAGASVKMAGDTPAGFSVSAGVGYQFPWGKGLFSKLAQTVTVEGQ